jgi:4-diphosphocytidyl-2-C-methyl-D-erythritol kinase
MAEVVTVTASAPAKVNLFLRVLARESDGFHGIETLFCRIDLADELTASRSSDLGVRLQVSGAETGPESDNLAYRAAEMVLAATSADFGVDLTLTKRIPVQAGLGGGSSDAAATLGAVNRLCGQAVPRHELLQFGQRLGSDVPFFLTEAPLALGWGHGERLLRLAPLPVRPGLLLIPPAAVATGQAYGWVDQGRSGGDQRRGAVALAADTLQSWGDIARLAGNDFESPVFTRLPEVRAAFEALVQTAPLMCRMSGSGSALFAVYRSAQERADAEAMLGPRLGRVVAFSTAA